MTALWAVYKREVALYFRSFIAYGIAFALLAFIGLYFAGNIAFVQQSAASGNMQGGGVPATDIAIANLSIFTFLMFLIAPLLTMRLISEEAREGTLEVLMTLPMGEWVFVVGKFLAAWTYYTILLLVTVVYMVMLAQISPINMGLAFSAYLGAWLYGGASLAVCIIWSAVTEDQLVAAFLGAATVLAFFLADSLAIIVSDQATFAGASGLIRELGFSTHFQSTLMNGLVRAEDITFFVLFMIVALFITTIIVGTRRWRNS